MSSLRNAPLFVSVVLCSLASVHCGAERLPAHAPESSIQVETAAWMEVGSEEDADEGSAEEAFRSHLASLQEQRRWTYDTRDADKGPARWSALHPDYQACSTGTMQSPIDIVTKDAAFERSLELIDFGYSKVPLRIFNDGRTVQVENDSPAAINAAGATWKLVRMQLHSPSEHTIDGKRADLELELIHRDAGGQLAAVSVLFRAGNENEALAPVFDAIPAEVTAEAPRAAGASFDLSNVVPAAPSYYSYTGSLTTPDCTEGVRWFVLSPVGEVSQAQIEKLQAAVGPVSNRPVQPLGSRRVLRPL